MAFASFLRQHHYNVGIDDVVSAMHALPLINLGSYADFLQLIQICFARNHEQWKNVRQLYEDFIKDYKKGIDSKVIEKPEEKNISKPKANSERKYQLDDIKKWLFNLKDSETLETPYFSPFTSEEKSFIDLNSGELLQLDFWIKKLLIKIASERSRKKKRNLTRGELDLKYLIKNKFVKGDELVRLYYRYLKKEKSKVVFLCDVSKSMDLYSRFILSFIRQLPQIFDHCNTYFFNTELHEVENPESWKEVSGLWAGGTRIGYSFNEWIEKRPDWFDKKTKIIIYSDGWDTGDLDLLDKSMYKMQQLAAKIIWLNPVIKDGNDIQASGMNIAKPHIGILAPVYNVKTLKELVRVL